MPNLVAPGRRALGKRGDRTRPADAVVIIPTDLRRPDAPAAAPAQPTLQIPASLIAPAPLPGSTRRGKAGPAHPTPPRAEDITLNMPRLVRNPTILPEPGAAPLQAAAEAHAADPADLAQEPAPTTAAEPPASDLSQAPARDDLSQAPAQDDLSQAPAPAEPAPTAAEPTPATPVTPADPDAALAAYLQDPEDPAALASLRGLGEALYPRIAARFPGPIDPRSAADVRSFPPPSSHGPLLRLCVEIGPPITRHILDLLEHQRPQIRFYAAFLFQELRDPRSLRPLAGHAFDPDPDVRLIATRVLESYSRVEGFVPATEVVRSALSGRDRDRALLATEAAGTLRDTRAVPILIDLLSVRDKQIREASLEALCSITAKHHGYRPAKWKAWYADHQDQPRVLWVMEALKHRDPAVRRWAAEELLRVTGHRIPAPPEGEKITPRYVLRAWEAWFEQHGADFG
jgi:HEAT repeat protein